MLLLLSLALAANAGRPQNNRKTDRKQRGKLAVPEIPYGKLIAAHQRDTTWQKDNLEKSFARQCQKTLARYQRSVAEREQREEQDRVVRTQEQERLVREEQERVAREEQERLEREQQERADKKRQKKLAHEQHQKRWREEQERLVREEQERLVKEQERIDALARESTRQRMQAALRELADQRIAKEREEQVQLAREQQERLDALDYKAMFDQNLDTRSEDPAYPRQWTVLKPFNYAASGLQRAKAAIGNCARRRS